MLREEVKQSVNASMNEGDHSHPSTFTPTPLFKGIPNFRDTRIAMLRTESADDLFRIL